MSLLDPFCGSGAILQAISLRNFPVTGLDINPYAVLLSRVKLDGFDRKIAEKLCEAFLMLAGKSRRLMPIAWDAKAYWFTDATLLKYEKLRYVANKLDLYQSPEGRAILLAYALSVRRCSRADQRSPKPFISKLAIKTRSGKHFDPYVDIKYLLSQLGKLHGQVKNGSDDVRCLDLRTAKGVDELKHQFTHIITSPPYINAQDYFRNFKLELHLLEGVLPFRIGVIKYRFIGTERGNLTVDVRDEDIEYHRRVVPRLKSMEKTHPRQSAIVHRYFADMRCSFIAMRSCLKPHGKLILVCGDNLVGGYRVITWKILSIMLEDLGFVLYERFGDKIGRRNVPPKRNGHTGLIKQEVVSAFTLADR